MTSNTTTFPQFQQFPAEIRCQIWRYCFRQRTISIGYRRDHWWTYVNLWPLRDITQPIAAVCYDALHEAAFHRKPIEPALSHAFNPIQWLNHSTDTLYIQPPDSYEDNALSLDAIALLEWLFSSGITISFHHRLLSDWKIWEGCPDDRTPHELWRQLKEAAQTRCLQVVVMESDLHLTRDETLSTGLWGPFAEPGDIAYSRLDKFLGTSRLQRGHAIWRALSLSFANRSDDGVEVGCLVVDSVNEWRERVSSMAQTSSTWFDQETRRALASQAGNGSVGVVHPPPATPPPVMFQQRRENWIRLCDDVSPEALVPVVKLQWRLHGQTRV
ncbi:hypothetical protein QC764_511368 [Podospora pseudoanserina]|uniref:2EXR domain-containing protein n=1 Tax=Podospora pseudoanserina TaxID=2609844 RepID=A0ABR0I7E2_9PEZI|nr:hypothetical protein QC764_511368 [Podospora pseudoanserina]